MRRLVVLGAGTAGTMMVNKLRRRMGREWKITVVEQSDLHYYQPGYVFLPFGKNHRSVPAWLPLSWRAPAWSPLQGWECLIAGD